MIHLKQCASGVRTLDFSGDLETDPGGSSPRGVNQRLEPQPQPRRWQQGQVPRGCFEGNHFHPIREVLASWLKTETNYLLDALAQLTSRVCVHMHALHTHTCARTHTKLHRFGHICREMGCWRSPCTGSAWAWRHSPRATGLEDGRGLFGLQFGLLHAFEQGMKIEDGLPMGGAQRQGLS